MRIAGLGGEVSGAFTQVVYAPGGQVTLGFNWPFAALPAGTYTVQLTVQGTSGTITSVGYHTRSLSVIPVYV